jgi:hypothetical protein
VQLFGRRPEHALALLKAAWSSAVGSELARRTEVLALEGRTLRVRVPDAHWQKVLHRLRRDILTRLHALAGGLAPTAIGYQEGQLLAPPNREASVPTAEAEPPRLRAIEDAAAVIDDPDLRERFTAAASRYLAKSARKRT